MAVDFDSGPTHDGRRGGAGYTSPAYILAVHSPGIVGTLLVWRYHGVRGLRNFFGRLTMWRMPTVWWAFPLLGDPAAPAFTRARSRAVTPGRRDAAQAEGTPF